MSGPSVTQASRSYINIYGGKMVHQFKNPIEGQSEDWQNTAPRENKEGKTVHELFYNNFEGMLWDISKRETNYGPKWDLFMKAQGEPWLISFDYEGKLAKQFFTRIENVDLNEELKISVGMGTDKSSGKDYYWISLSQMAERADGRKEWKKIDARPEYAWSEENPGKLPPAEWITVSGSDVLDFTKQLQYFEMIANSLPLKGQEASSHSSASRTNMQPEAVQGGGPGKTDPQWVQEDMERHEAEANVAKGNEKPTSQIDQRQQAQEDAAKTEEDRMVAAGKKDPGSVG